MEILGFKIEMLNEIKAKWESKLKVLGDTYDKKKEALAEDYKKKKENLEKFLDHKDFKEVLLEKLEADLLSPSKEIKLKAHLKEILDTKKKSIVLIGRLQNIEGYRKGNFNYGFKILYDDGNTEIDFSEFYLKEEMSKLVDRKLNEELLNEYED
jgi:DUF971 family protein